MSLTPALWERVEALLAAGDVSFVDMVAIAGIDKTKAFRHGDVRRCQLSGQDLNGFDFTGAKFDGATLTRAIFTGAILDNADLSHAIGVRDAVMDGAQWNDQTIWPEDFWPRPPWADAAGRDGFGPWARFSVTAADGTPVRQRLRWIPEGSFQMGSPEGEPGRLDWEGPRQTITFAHGFWMFDTPCTQALWSAVMNGQTVEEEVRDRGPVERWLVPGMGRSSFGQGVRRVLWRLNPFGRKDAPSGGVAPDSTRTVRRDLSNPSYFKSPDRPVEMVSFNDATRFIRRLNQMKPGLHLSLPSEAQWEYACRAGTVEATYAGPIAILGINNAPVLDGIAWYGGNSGQGFDLDNGYDSSDWKEKQYDDTRAGTHPVGRKRPNAWGLYDTLGNVWEWCADEWHDTHDGAPAGGASAAKRVIRGGAWFNEARFVRAACRDGLVPSYRNYDFGFRCARDHEQTRSEERAGHGGDA